MKPYPRLYQPLIDKHIERVGEQEAVRTLGKIVDAPWFNYRPLPQARRFHQSLKSRRFNLGGNRSSKSHALAHDAAMIFLGTHPYRSDKKPVRVCYATVNWEMVGTILWAKVKDILRGSDFEVVWHNKARDIPKRLIRNDTRGRSSIDFMAYEQGREAFQGVEFDYIYCDEQFPQDVYIELISRIGGGKAAQFSASFTPITSQPWLEEKLNNPDDDTDVFEFPLDDNRKSQGGFIDDVLIDNMIAEWPDEIVETRRKGKWASFLGAVYRSFSRAIHVVPTSRDLEFLPGGSVPVGAELVGGIDWGGINPFVFLWAFRVPHMDGAWFVADEYYWESRKRGQRLIEDHAKEITQKTKRLNSDLFRVWSDHDAQDRFEMDAHGVPSWPAVKEVRAGIETVQTYLKPRAHGDKQIPRLFISERCQNLIREISSYKWPDATKNRDAHDVPLKIDDHSVDCLRYILHSEEKSFGHHGGEPVRPIATPGNRRAF